MHNIFITRRNALLANWQEAFPKATYCQEISIADLSPQFAYLFWIHSHADRHQWLEKTMNNIAKNYPNSRVVVLANIPEQDDAVKVMGRGALGYCHAYSAAEILLEVKTVIDHGGVWLGRDFLQSLIKATTGLVNNNKANIDATLALLTKREREVALQAANGHSNKEIARILQITERTVKAHLSSSFERLGVKDRLQLALVLKDNSKV